MSHSKPQQSFQFLPSSRSTYYYLGPIPVEPPIDPRLEVIDLTSHEIPPREANRDLRPSTFGATLSVLQNSPREGTIRDDERRAKLETNLLQVKQKVVPCVAMSQYFRSRLDMFDSISNFLQQVRTLFSNLRFVGPCRNFQHCRSGFGSITADCGHQGMCPICFVNLIDAKIAHHDEYIHYLNRDLREYDLRCGEPKCHEPVNFFTVLTRVATHLQCTRCHVDEAIYAFAKCGHLVACRYCVVRARPIGSPIVACPFCLERSLQLPTSPQHAFRVHEWARRVLPSPDEQWKR